jgi:hypothetical protein
MKYNDLMCGQGCNYHLLINANQKASGTNQVLTHHFLARQRHADCCFERWQNG